MIYSKLLTNLQTIVQATPAVDYRHLNTQITQNILGFSIKIVTLKTVAKIDRWYKGEQNKYSKTILNKTLIRI